MMTSTLSFRRLPLAEAQACAERLEEEAGAVSIIEADPAGGLWDVVAYFSDPGRADTVRDRMAAGGGTGLREELPAADWVRRSFEGLKPVAAGRFLLHGSHDRERRRPGGVSLEIDAGTAFGTGHHGTTQGCLLALDSLLKKKAPRRILDVGCGTGVLALAAARSLRRRVLAGDMDGEAVRVTRANAGRNGATPLIRVVETEGLAHPVLRDGGPYDLILANILARPLIALARDLVRALGPNGTLILSGLTQDQISWVAASYLNRGMALRGRLILGDWVVLVLEKQNARRRRASADRSSGAAAARRRRFKSAVRGAFPG